MMRVTLLDMTSLIVTMEHARKLLKDGLIVTLNTAMMDMLNTIQVLMVSNGKSTLKKKYLLNQRKNKKKRNPSTTESTLPDNSGTNSIHPMIMVSSRLMIVNYVPSSSTTQVEQHASSQQSSGKMTRLLVLRFQILGQIITAYTLKMDGLIPMSLSMKKMEFQFLSPVQMENHGISIPTSNCSWKKVQISKNIAKVSWKELIHTNIDTNVIMMEKLSLAKKTVIIP